MVDLDIEGTASRDGDVRPFVGKLTITSNRQDSSQQFAGADTICKKRIVSPIATSTQVEATGGLPLRIDPRLLFVNVDFGKPSANLYTNLLRGGAAPGAALYSFVWDEHLWVTPRRGNSGAHR